MGLVSLTSWLHWVEYDSKTFSNGYWDTLALENTLLRGKNNAFKENYSINGMPL